MGKYKPFVAEIKYTGLAMLPKEVEDDIDTCVTDWCGWHCDCGAYNHVPAIDFKMRAFLSYPYMAERFDVIKRNITRMCWKCGLKETVA